MKLYPNELATVLAALRYWQRHALREAARLENGVADLMEGDIATDGGELPPMTAEEIDSLCERINTDSFGEPRLNAKV